MPRRRGPHPGGRLDKGQGEAGEAALLQLRLGQTALASGNHEGWESDSGGGGCFSGSFGTASPKTAREAAGEAMPKTPIVYAC
jgi:hypothetical protein